MTPETHSKKLLFLLNKENLAMSRREIERLLSCTTEQVLDNVALCTFPTQHAYAEALELIARLALTRVGSEVLIESTTDEEFLARISNSAEMQQAFAQSDLARIAKHAQLRIDASSFGVFIPKDIHLSKSRSALSTRAVGSALFAPLQTALGVSLVVDLDNPAVAFDLILAQEKRFLALRIWENEEEFNARKPHLREVLHPSGMHPRTARALINLSGAKTEVLDPLCGTGGILIEAGLMKLHAIGVDIDRKLLFGAKKNLESLGVTRGTGAGQYTLHTFDSTRLPEIISSTECIITDVPYGLHSKAPLERKAFYDTLLAAFSRVTRKAVVMMPHFVLPKEIVEKSAWKIVDEFEIYVHKGLSRKIFVLEK